jgi:hypothetical protein
MLKNSCVVPEPFFPSYAVHLIFFPLLVALLLCPTNNAFSQVVVPLSDIFQDVKGETIEVQKLGDRLFIGTTEGLWIVDSRQGKPARQTGIAGGVRYLIKYAEQIFIVTDVGLWHATGSSSPVHIKEISNVINYQTQGDQLFFATSEGLWRVGKGADPIKYKEINGGVEWLEGFGSRLFVSTADDSWIIDENSQLKSIVKTKSDIAAIAAFNEKLFIKTEDDDLWVITKEGELSLFNGVGAKVNTLMPFSRYLFIGAKKSSWLINEKDELYPVKEFSDEAGNSSVLGDSLFINIGKNSWILDKDGTPQLIEEIKGRVNFNVTIEGKVYAAADDGLWIIDGNSSPVLKSEIRGRTNRIMKYDGGERLFVNTENGSWVMNKEGQLNPVAITEKVNAVAEFGEHLLVGTDKNLWIADSDGNNPVKIENISGNIVSIIVFEKNCYIKTGVPSPRKFYWMDPKLKISTKLASTSWWTKILPSTWAPTGKLQPTACYSYLIESCDNSYSGIITEEFSFSTARGNNKPDTNQFSTQDQFSYELNSGSAEFNYWIKDKWGNISRSEKIEYYGIPIEYLTLLLYFIIWQIVVLILIALAPNSYWCNYIIMKPWIRGFLSLGTIPLFFHLNSIRNRILRRYSAALDKSDKFAGLIVGFNYPKSDFKPEKFEKKLKSKKAIMIVGQTVVVGKSYLKHLTAYFASKSKSIFSERTFPVYISLKEKKESSFENLVYEALLNYGEVNSEFAPIFLERGRLFIFFDGVGELDAFDREKLNTFITKYRRRNYICLSSLQDYPEIKNVQQEDF